MTRNLDSATETASESSVIAPIALVKLSFPDGDVRFWTGWGDFDHDGETYTGAGDLGFIGPIDEDSDLTRNTMEIGLRGIPNEIVSIVLGQQYQGRDCTIYFGYVDPDTRLFVGDPVIFTGKMDYPSINLGKECAISLKVEDEFATLDKPKVRRYNNADQQSRHPGDKFFEFAEQSADEQIAWGTRL